MAVGDVYEITDTQRLFNQTVSNVFHYRQKAVYIADGITTAEALAGQWIEEVLPVIRACQTGDLLHTQVSVRNLFDAADQFTQPLSEVGSFSAATASTAPSFVQLPFVLIGGNAAVKNGAKRLAGIEAGVAVDGVVTNSTMTTNSNNMADALLAEVSSGGALPGFIWEPIIVKRVRSGSPGAYEYRMPESIAELVYSLVVDVIWRAILGSQISRKIGVGN